MAKIHKDLIHLEAVGLIRVVQTHPELEYLFRHALVQEVAYRSLLREDRKKLHHQVGEAMEDVYANRLEELASELGHHFSIAENFGKAIYYLTLAGKRSVQQSANQEAITHFTQALAFLEKLPDTPERTEQELDLQIALGGLLLVTKGDGAPEVGQAYERAFELGQQIGDSPQLFSALRGLAMFYKLQGESETAHKLTEQMVSLAHRLEDPALVVETSYAMGSVLFLSGKFGPAQEYLEQGIDSYDRQQHHSLVLLYDQDPGVANLSYASMNLWYLGYPDRALERGLEALALAQELSHPYSLAMALNWMGWVHLYRRETHAVQERTETTISLSEKHGFPLFVAVGTLQRGWALAEQGEVEEGIVHVQRGIAVADLAMGAELAPPPHLALLAELYGKLGQPEEGLRVLGKVPMPLDKKRKTNWGEPELYRLNGELLLMQADEAEAEASFQQAIAIARRQEAKSLELRATVSLARLWHSQGKQEEARQILEEIYRWFTEGFDTVDLQEAKALLETLARNCQLMDFRYI